MVNGVMTESSECTFSSNELCLCASVVSSRTVGDDEDAVGADEVEKDVHLRWVGDISSNGTWVSFDTRSDKINHRKRKEGRAGMEKTRTSLSGVSSETRKAEGSTEMSWALRRSSVVSSISC